MVAEVPAGPRSPPSPKTPVVAPSQSDNGMAERDSTMDEFRLQYRVAKPKPPDKCALLCCFYAEFDIHVGPKIKHQSPETFMEHRLPVSSFCNTLLREAFFMDSTPVTASRKTSDAVEAPESLDASQSIFKACSEYIIPSSDELTGNILNLSTHDIHLLTRPTIIHDEKYERNNLLFCVGFVLRRNEDPRPFQPALSRLALHLRDIEVEHEFLSRSQSKIQTLLNQVLLSLNSKDNECNLVAASNVLNLKLYRPPKIAEIPLPDHSVPILLQRDWHITYDWDLAIIWVSLHIDGVINAKQISKYAEVDMEMVRACLRVLKHHGVIALIDMFFYSNRYENTKQSKLLCDDKIMRDAVAFIAKKEEKGPMGINYNSDSSPELTGVSPSTDVLLGHFQSQNLASTFDSTSQIRRGLGASHHTIVANPPESHLRPEDYEKLRRAIAEFYYSCSRSHSVGELWVDLVSNRDSSSSINWKSVSKVLDHRRLITFGIVQGIIRRVHNYPSLIDDGTDASQESLGTPETSRPSSPFHVSTQQLYEVEKRRMALKVAKLLDGTNCDDALVCELELPLEDILKLLPGKRIVSVFV